MSSPSVAVLLAAYNGSQFIEEQVASVCSQVGVAVSIYFRDDGSTDGTVELVRSLPHGNIQHVDHGGSRKGPGGNFLSLLCAIPIEQHDFVAFADQDDIWFPGKLQKAVSEIEQSGSGGYSADLLAFDNARCRASFVRKAGVPRRLDYLFQTASAGCTYVLTKELAILVRDRVMPHLQELPRSVAHDWIVYAICRSHGLSWRHSSEVSIAYRQHGANVHGAGGVWRDALKKVKMLRSVWYKENILWLRRVLSLSQEEREVLRRVERLSLMDRLWLIRRASMFRRSGADVFALRVIFMASLL